MAEYSLKKIRGGVLLETAVVLSVLVLLVGIIVDIRFIFNEKACMKDATQFGARVTAMAPAAGLTPEELRSFAMDSTKSALETCGLDPSKYFIDIWGIEDRVVGKVEHQIQVTASTKGLNRFFLLPDGMFEGCAGSVYFMKSRKRVASTEISFNNARCNPARVKKSK